MRTAGSHTAAIGWPLNDHAIRSSAAPEQPYGAPLTATIALVYGNRLHVGGVETHLLSLLRHGDRTRYRWVLVSATSAGFAARARALGAQVVPWEPAHNLDLPALTHLRRLLRAQRADLVHMHSPRAATFGRLAARALRRPAVVTIHIPAYYGVVGSGPRARLKRAAYLRLDALLNRRFTDRLIYVSARVRQE